ncbi:MAG: hypothetical protein JRD87_16185 [Deltaproteobacteria bacterium]|jgi:tetrahydromethanopterin S-methyltransferase subunit A|nr:hypothetical protein [Deltaproteobacteria bacterium]MBW2671380.1 hypothetical protein [Deltaproteobacteria bacterium]
MLDLRLQRIGYLFVNIVIANPNIRYVVLGGPESPGHSTGDALKSFLKHGVDGKKKIMGTEAPDASLFNLSKAMPMT